ncbi:putative gag-pol poly protein [Colletotrichum tabaci]|uniref:RNA-directed DNA polymerase n=1 Tax=Colletotrichum tabaci TaxID=1209068 RepID=A0AAV9T996_9PEZI
MDQKKPAAQQKDPDTSIDALLGAIAARIQTSVPQVQASAVSYADQGDNVNFYKIPFPGQDGAAVFKGDNIVEFLEKFEDQCEIARVPDRFRGKLAAYTMGGDYQTPVKDAIGTLPWTQAKAFLLKEYGRQDANRFLDEEEQIEKVTKGPPIASSDLSSAQALFTKIDNVIARAKRQDLHIMTDKSLIKAVCKRFHVEIVKEAAEEVGVTLEGFVRSTKYVKFKAGLLDAIAHKKEYSPLFADDQNANDSLPQTTVHQPRGNPSYRYSNRQPSQQSATDTQASQPTANKTDQDLADGMSKLKIYQNSVYSRGPARVFEVNAMRPDRPNMMGPKDRCWYCWSQQHRFIRECDQYTIDKDAHLVILIQGLWYYGRRDGQSPMNNIPFAVIEEGRKRGVADRVTLFSHVSNMSTDEDCKTLAKQTLEQQVGLPWQTDPALPSSNPQATVRCVHVVRPENDDQAYADVYAVRRGRPPKNRSPASDLHSKTTYGAKKPEPAPPIRKRTVSFSEKEREIMDLDDDDYDSPAAPDLTINVNSNTAPKMSILQRPKPIETVTGATQADSPTDQNKSSHENLKILTVDQPRDFDLHQEARKIAEKKLEAPVSLPVGLLRKIWPEFNAAMGAAMRDQGYADTDGILLEAPKSLIDLAETSQQRKNIEKLLDDYNKAISTGSAQTAKMARVKGVESATKLPTSIISNAHLQLEVRMSSVDRNNKGAKIVAILDTGAQVNILSKQYVETAGIPYTPTRLKMQTFKSDPNSLTTFDGFCFTDVWIDRYKVTSCFFIKDERETSDPLLLGLPFVQDTKLSFGYNRNLITALIHAEDALLRIPVGVIRTNDSLEVADILPQLEHMTGNAARSDDPYPEPELEHDEHVAAVLDQAQAEEIMTIVAQDMVEPQAALIRRVIAVTRGNSKNHQYKTDTQDASCDLAKKPISRQEERSVMRRIAKHYTRATRLFKTVDEAFDGFLRSAKVNTMYKRKDQKVQPVDDAPSDGSTPDGDPHWKLKKLEEIKDKLQDRSGPFGDLITPKFSIIEPGSRLTNDRLETILKDCQHLLPREKELFKQILLNREKALAWDFPECGRLDPMIAPPQVIRTIPHKAWQAKGIPIPKALLPKAFEVIRQRVARGIIEESHAAYRNPWFLVLKKDGGLRLINSATKVNAVTLRDAWQPPSADEFSEEFATDQLVSLLDFFSGYDQISLDEKSRDLTTFSTPLGLYRYCTLPMGATNSVAQFCRIMTRILYDLIPKCCNAFVDDIAVKGPRSRYNDEELPDYPGIRRFVYEHLNNIDRVLVNVELAGCTVSGAKSQWCQTSAVIVGYLCGTEGRRPDQAKILKILEWDKCNSVSDVRSFLGIVTFYRCWIERFSEIAAPLYSLLGKNRAFDWSEQQSEAMAMLKASITTAPVLIPLDYSPEAGRIVLTTDASIRGWGSTLGQIKNDKRVVARYESGIWRGPELKYDAGKLEMRGVLMSLKRLRNYLFGINFLLETDARVLVAQINGAANDLPSAMMTRWLAWIRLFDFEIKHIDGKKNTAADGLSRKPPGPSDLKEAGLEEDIEDFIDCKVLRTRVAKNFFLAAHNRRDSSPDRTGEIDIPPDLLAPEELSLDVQHIGKWKVVEARCEFTGYIEARIMKHATSANIAKFIWEDIICRHGIYGTLIIDGGRENMGAVTQLNRRCGSRRKLISAYNPRANGLLEKGHQPIAHTLRIWSDQGKKDIRPILATALFADRTTVRASSGYTPFYLVYGRHAVTPIENRTATWRVLDWDSIRTPDQETQARLRAFAHLEEDRQNAADMVTRHRALNRDRFNSSHTHALRKARLRKGDLVLVFDVQRKIDMSTSRKLDYYWQGPYRIHSVAPNGSSFQLENLAGEVITGATYAGNRLKKFLKSKNGLYLSPDEPDLRGDFATDLTDILQNDDPSTDQAARPIDHDNTDSSDNDHDTEDAPIPPRQTRSQTKTLHKV